MTNKYNIGDTVYFLQDDIIVTSTITKIQLTYRGIEYCVHGLVQVFFQEKELYTSKQAVIDYLMLGEVWVL